VRESPQSEADTERGLQGNMADNNTPSPSASSPAGASLKLSPQERNQLEEYPILAPFALLVLTFTFRQAQSLQDGLSALLDRIDSVKEGYQKLQTENNLLQEWIGNSIQQNAKAKPRS